MKVKKKGKIAEVRQLTAGNRREVAFWAGGVTADGGISVRLESGERVQAVYGDYVILGEDGFSVCPEAKFKGWKVIEE
jgi:hypothetical protein